MAITHADDANFKAEVEGTTGLIVVDFYADWCGPCKMFGPIFEEVSAEYPNVKFIKVDTQAAPNLAGEANIMSIPAILFIKNGKEIERKLGMMSKEALKSKIEELKNKAEEPNIGNNIRSESETGAGKAVA